MIKIENTDVSGWKAAIRGMRNPMNSWAKSDSLFDFYSYYKTDADRDNGFDTILAHDILDDEFEDPDMSTTIPHSSFDMLDKFALGKNDHELMMRLAKSGSVDAKFRRMIVVSVDITAPEYWWAEFDTYKIGTVRNSCSKMHKLLSKPFEMNDFSFDKLPGYKNSIKQYRPKYDEVTEEWKPFKDTDYLFSNKGRIKHKERELFGSLHQDGYIFVTIYGKQIPVHRIIATLFIDNSEDKPEVNHKDGNKMNNCSDNLEWVTRKENIIHTHENDLQPYGLSTYRGKFSDEEREEIKRLYNEEMYSCRSIANLYSVSHTCIRDILNERYRYAEKVNAFETIARPLIDTLNELRDAYLRNNDPEIKKQIWYMILQLLPISYNQRATVMLNYEVLANIYRSRKDHKLDEWREFCKWIEMLPYSELITLKDS